MHRLTPVLLRAAGVAALILLLWNPLSSRPAPAGAFPVVLLDASLSMRRGDGGFGGGGGSGGSGQWRAAVDSARAAARGGAIWRFGHRSAAFDTAPPSDGASRLGPALEAAAARGGEVVVVTDGELTDVTTLAPDLLLLPRVIHVGRPATPAWDAFVARVEGPERVTATDTVRLRVTYGTAGKGERGKGKGDAVLTASVAGRQLASKRVTLPDSGMLSAEISHAASRIPAGWSVVEVRLEGVGDGEPRDDARFHAVEVSAEPHAVLLAAPPSWDSRFLAQAVEDVARVPLRVFVDPGSGERVGWRDGRTLLPVAAPEVSRAVQGARLLVLAGERAAAPAGPAREAAVLRLPAGAGRGGDWYIDPPPASPVAGALTGVDWSALPPATSLADGRPDSGALVVLSATLARRGTPRPIVVLEDSGGRRRATIRAEGLWRWQFRGESGAVAYRTLVAALIDWLLAGEGGGGRRERAVPEARVVPNGMPVVWRWVGAGEPRDVAVRLDGPDGARTDTLRFGADGREELALPPGVYRYTLAGGAERGIVAVESYSDEWRPQPVTLATQPGRPGGRTVTVGVRDRWWLFVVAILAFVGEWAWRRRQGLP